MKQNKVLKESVSCMHCQGNHNACFDTENATNHVHQPMKQNTTDLEKQIREICESLYQTGFNSAKNNIKHLPTPVGYRVDQILQLITDREKEIYKSMESVLKRNSVIEYKYLIGQVQNSMNNKLANLKTT